MNAAADALMAAREELAAIADRLRTKARETGDKTHFGTAAGISLACVKLIEMADKTATGGDAKPSMPREHVDPITRTRLRASTYLHGGGSGDAGLQITLVDDLIERAVCLRVPGPAAEEWLTSVHRALRDARKRAVIEPWGPEGD